MELFSSPSATEPDAPLAARMRPQRLAEIVGQTHLIGPEGVLTRTLARGFVPSLLLWGPPGTGKTTLAGVIGATLGARFVALSAVLSGVKDIREAIASAGVAKERRGERTILFIDEIHRFNKAQQDALLPHVEQGTITLIGATTENPSFEVNAALLSRCRVLVLKPHDTLDLGQLLDRALTAPHGLGERKLSIHPEAHQVLVEGAQGDARRLLTTLELAADLLSLADAGSVISREHAEQALGRRLVLFDKNGDQHYDVISALIKSMRGSDPDAALHYLARLISAGEDPHFILRRLIIFASEDVGNADPRALQVAVAAQAGFDVVGLPEGELLLAQAVTFLSTCPKSNASYVAIGRAKADLDRHPNAPIPLHLTNAPTQLMKSLGRGEGYRYPHDYPGGFVPQSYRPVGFEEARYYEPTSQGLEKTIGERLAGWRAQQAASQPDTTTEPLTSHHKTR